MNARRPISSGVIASIPKVKKKTTTVWIARFWLNLRYCILKQLFCQILLHKLTVIDHRLLNSERKHFRLGPVNCNHYPFAG